MTRNTSWASVFPGLWLFTVKLVVNYIQMSFYRCSDFFHSIFSGLGLCCLFLIFQSSDRLTIDSPARMFLPAFLVRKLCCLSLGLKCCFLLAFCNTEIKNTMTGMLEKQKKEIKERNSTKRWMKLGLWGLGGFGAEIWWEACRKFAKQKVLEFLEF